MQIILSRGFQDLMTIVLPENFRLKEPQIIKSLLKMQPDLDFLTSSQYVRIVFKYVNSNYFTSMRKYSPIVDQRESDEHYNEYN